MSARPFQVGDRVRITDYLRHNQHPDAQYVYEGVVEKIDPAADPDSELEYGPYLWAETEAYTSPLSGEVFDRVFCPMTDDLTTGSDGDDTLGRTIELLEPASEPIYLTLDGATMKRHTTDPDLEDLRDAGWDEIDAPEQEDDGMVGESLAEVCVPVAIGPQPGDRVLDGYDIPGTVLTKELWWSAEQLERFPEHVVVSFDDRAGRTLVHPSNLRPAAEEPAPFPHVLAHGRARSLA